MKRFHVEHNDSKPYRMSPEDIMIFRESKRPRQWAFAILKLKPDDRETAYLAIPKKYREWVKEIVGETLRRQRCCKKLEEKSK